MALGKAAAPLVTPPALVRNARQSEVHPPRRANKNNAGRHLTRARACGARGGAAAPLLARRYNHGLARSALEQSVPGQKSEMYL